MKIYNDKELANDLLETRRDPMLRGQLVRNRKQLIQLLILLGLAFAAIVWSHTWNIFALPIGLVLGIYSQERVYMRIHKQTWPFFLKVIDWEKVEKLTNDPAA